jgi:hypothetical protein
MRRCIVVSTLIILIVSFYGVATAQKVETKDGVRIIHNSKEGIWQKSPKISLEKVLEIGDIEALSEDVAFYMPLDIALDAEGNLYVLDTGNHRIQKFSPEGEFLATIGRKGQGPGEFNFPGSLDIDKQGNLIVASPYIKRIQVINAAGQEIHGVTITGDFSHYLRVLGPEHYIAATRRRMPLPEEEGHMNGLDPLLQVMDRECNVLKTFGKARDYKHGFVNQTGNEVRYAVGPDGLVYVSFRHQDRIEKYTAEGELIWRSERDLGYKTDKPLNKGKVERMKGGGISINSPDWNRCSEAVTADGEGRIWVLTYDRQLKESEQGGTSIRISGGGSGSTISMSPHTEEDLPETTDAFKLEVFDSEGVLLQSFPLDHYGDNIEISGSRIYILDKVRHMKVHVYQIGGQSPSLD